jgi:hypothetical protein
LKANPFEFFAAAEISSSAKPSTVLSAQTLALIFRMSRVVGPLCFLSIPIALLEGFATDCATDSVSMWR